MDNDFMEAIKAIDDITQKLENLCNDDNCIGSRRQQIAKDTCIILQLAREVLLIGLPYA